MLFGCTHLLCAPPPTPRPPPTWRACAAPQMSNSGVQIQNCPGASFRQRCGSKEMFLSSSYCSDLFPDCFRTWVGNRTRCLLVPQPPGGTSSLTGVGGGCRGQKGSGSGRVQKPLPAPGLPPKACCVHLQEDSHPRNGGSWLELPGGQAGQEQSAQVQQTWSCLCAGATGVGRANLGYRGAEGCVLDLSGPRSPVPRLEHS